MSHHLSTAAQPSLGARFIYGVLGILLVLSGIYLGLYFSLNSSWGQRQLQTQVVQFNEAYKGTLSLENLRVAPNFSGLVLTGLELKSEDGRSLVKLPGAFLDISLSKFLLDKDQSPALHILGKHARIRVDEEGQNDLLQALSPRVTPPEELPPTTPPPEVSKTPDVASYPAFRPPYRMTFQLEELSIATPHGEGYVVHDLFIEAALLTSASAPVTAHAHTGLLAASLNRGRTTLEVDQAHLTNIRISPGQGFSLEALLTRHDGTYASLHLAQSPSAFEIEGAGLLQAHDIAALTGKLGLGLIHLEGLYLALHSATADKPASTTGRIGSLYTPWLHTEDLHLNELRFSVPSLEVQAGALLPTVKVQLEDLSIGHLTWANQHLWGLDVAQGLVEFNSQLQVFLGQSHFSELHLTGLADSEAPFAFGPGTFHLESNIGLRGGPTHIVLGCTPLHADLTLLWRYAPLSKRTTRTLSLWATSHSLQANARLFAATSETPLLKVPLTLQATYELSLDEEQVLLSLTDSTLEPTSSPAFAPEDSP